ncbi:MAG TPA: ABC transporter ATP-binding protein [Candidatus Bathyarchaeia archaeon]|nr:ABC transporter ATP-binding protein [Candidatus Bathyarchaeia archaeon]
MNVVSAAGVGKTYPGGTEALRDVSFSVSRGQVFCLLGRNGAGKTTLLRILATQLRPSAGRATVLGYDVVSEARAIREEIAVVPQEARPYMMLSAFDHIYFRCLIDGMSRVNARARTREIMDVLGLWEHRDKLAADLSGGLRQRIIIGMALIRDTELLFLDEPTIGLDPLGRRTVWNLIRQMTQKGVTVMLTTHYMEEAEALADSLAIIDRGRTVFLGTVDEAKSTAGVETRVIIEPLRGDGTMNREVLTPRTNQEIIEIVQRGLKENLKVTFKPPSLEDAFIHLVGGSIEN